MCPPGEHGLGVFLVWPPDSFCLITVVLILNGHCQTISLKDFNRIICCLVAVECIIHAQGVLFCGYVLLALVHLSGLRSPACSALPAEPCPLFPWHQDSCQAIPAPHQYPRMVSTAACKFWLSNRVSYLGQCRQPTTAPSCSWSSPFPVPVQPQPPQWPHIATLPPSQGPVTATPSWPLHVTTQKSKHLEQECQVTALLPSPTGQALLIFGVRVNQRLPLTLAGNHIPAQQKFQQHWIKWSLPPHTLQWRWQEVKLKKAASPAPSSFF